MTNKVQLIKEEIERRISEFENEYPDDFGGYWNDDEVKALNCAEEYKRFLTFIDSLPEEHSEDLEREIGLYTTNSLLKKRNHDTGIYHLTQNDCDSIARHFAEWQKQQMKEALQTEYEKGRVDMRKEILKALVNGEIVKNLNNQLYVKSEPIKDTFGEAKFGNKVKIVVLKTE